MERRKIRFQTILNILLVLLALYMLLTLFVNRPEQQYPVRLRFYGEYSLNNDPWLPLEDAELSAMDGDLLLRGNFGMQIPENSKISFYAFHLGLSFEVNDKVLARSSAQECGYAQWITVQTPRISQSDEVLIRLSNLHGIGNAQAYQDLLDSFYLGEWELVEGAVSEQSSSRKIAGITVIAFALALLAVALVFSVLRLSMKNLLWHIGTMALCYGGYLCLSTPAAALEPRLATVNTCALYLCVIVATFVLGVLLSECLSDYRKTVATVILYLQRGGLLVLGMLFLFRRIHLCDVLNDWLPLQISSAAVMMILALIQWLQPGEKKLGLLGACMALFLVALLEALNEFFLLWPQRLLIDLAAALFFFYYAVHVVVSVPLSFRDASQTEKLRTDLEQSRIVLAMSQIHAHFIFNILNAISGMCKYDPQKADDTIIRFARYLRGNIDTMQEDRLESFDASLRHLEDYMALEQVRFGDRITFDTDIEATDFLLPPLVLQPLVENAIKHGCANEEDGLSIFLHTWREKDGVMITVEDDGVGFDTNSEIAKTSVGLSNVRFRLKQMAQGKLSIRSAPGQGTTVTIFIPNKRG